MVSRFPAAFRPPAFASRVILSRQGVGPSLRSAYQATIGPDPDGVSMVRSAQGAVPVLPPVRFPGPPTRTRRANLSASGSLRALPIGQPSVSVAGFGVHGVAILLPR